MIFSENRFPLFRLMLMLGMYVDNAARVVHRSGMSSLAPAGAGTLLRQPSIIFFLLSRSLSRFSSQIGAVAIGWQVYDMTGRAFDLGMVGLVQFLPTALLVFVAGFVLGMAGAFESPATAALLPLIAPQGSLQRATALSSGAAQIATITGPALGGFAYAIAPHWPYAIMLAFWLAAMLFTGAIEAMQAAPAKGAASAGDVFAGVRFI